MSKDKEYTILLKKQIAEIGKEVRSLEFKSNYQDAERLGKYISALSNGACLDNEEFGYLYFGVEDETLKLIGTTFDASRTKAKGNQNLEIFLRQYIMPKIDFKIEEFYDEEEKRFVVFTIPAAKGEPTCFMNIPYVRVDSSVADLRPYTEWMRIIYNSQKDWTAEVIPDATLDDLDPKAIRLARDKYKELHPSRNEEIDSWDDMTFLNKAHITRQGRVTNTAIILVGKEEASHFISPAVCQIRWQLKDGSDENKDFRILSIPMILAVEEFRHLVRNANYTFTISGNMFPETMQRYDVFTLREPLCNCIAHQDYGKKTRIEVIEYEDESLLFRNYGEFLPSSVEDVVEHNFPESKYRNPFLVEAMRNVKMVETEGGGIRKLYIQQKNRFFPMPEYDLNDGKVVCKIQGNVLDENFAKILVNNPDLKLPEIILLDKVQKHQPITDDTIALFRKKGYIEGRKPNIYLSAKIAKNSRQVGLKTTYVKNRSFDDDYFMDMILEYLKKFKQASRHDIDLLIIDKLSEVLTNKQKKSKVGNILTKLRKQGKIQSNADKKWVLC
ncbi:MAG: putative DNA binding domain-containing protein [Prevotellaceae bacterium]|nr:putative DNA binding domain-containing protein [Prevotellaceae bacterium]